jgi:hypothetical protein
MPCAANLVLCHDKGEVQCRLLFCCILQRVFDKAWRRLHSGGRVTDAAADAVLRKHQELLQSLKEAPRHQDRGW